MQKVGPITIDILGNQIKIGNKWLPGEKSESQFRVNSKEEIILPARTETILCGRSKAKSALLDYEFVPKLASRKGVYLFEALVQPDVHGQFLINALNTNNHSVRINSRTRMGNIISTSLENINYISHEVQGEFEDVTKEFDLCKAVKFGRDLNSEKREQLKKIIREHSNIFTKNTKKPGKNQHN